MYYVTHTPPPISEPSRSCANTIHKCDGIFQAQGGSDIPASEPCAILPVMPLPGPWVQEAHPGSFLSERALQLPVMVSNRKTSTPAPRTCGHTSSQSHSRRPGHSQGLTTIYSQASFLHFPKCVCLSQFGRRCHSFLSVVDICKCTAVCIVTTL